MNDLDKDEEIKPEEKNEWLFMILNYLLIICHIY